MQKITTFLRFDSKHPDPIKAKRVLEAMLQMRKIDVARLEKAAEG